MWLRAWLKAAAAARYDAGLQQAWLKLGCVRAAVDWERTAAMARQRKAPVAQERVS